MLARPETLRCVECGLSFDSPTFSYYYGLKQNGAAYFSDEGILCSPTCSIGHFKRRQGEGAVFSRPAPNPFRFDFS